MLFYLLIRLIIMFPYEQTHKKNTCRLSSLGVVNTLSTTNEQLLY
jgi:DTW domain-containing protein YfiP